MFEENSHGWQKHFYSHVAWCFGQFEKGVVCTKAMETLFPFTGHMMCLSVGTCSLGDSVGGATLGPITQYNR